MSFSDDTWRQLKSTTANELVKALLRDDWVEEKRRGATRVFTKPITNGSGRRRRVAIHYHPKKTYGASLLQGLLEDIGWNEDDLQRLRLIKRERKKSSSAP